MFYVRKYMHIYFLILLLLVNDTMTCLVPLKQLRISINPLLPPLFKSLLTHLQILNVFEMIPASQLPWLRPTFASFHLVDIFSLLTHSYLSSKGVSKSDLSRRVPDDTSLMICPCLTPLIIVQTAVTFRSSVSTCSLYLQCSHT